MSSYQTLLTRETLCLRGRGREWRDNRQNWSQKKEKNIFFVQWLFRLSFGKRDILERGAAKRTAAAMASSSPDCLPAIEVTANYRTEHHENVRKAAYAR